MGRARGLATAPRLDGGTAGVSGEIATFYNLISYLNPRTAAVTPVARDGSMHLVY